MQTTFHRLLAAACLAALTPAAQAQTTKPAAKPVVKPAAKSTAKPTAKPAPKPVAKPAPKPVAKPVAKPAPIAPAPAPTPPPAPPASPARATAAASSGPFAVGTNALNIGIGLGNRYDYGTGFFGGSSSVSPALSVSYERGVVVLGPGVLGVGLFAGYQGASYDLGSGTKWKYTDVIVTLRGIFHYPVSDQIDAYGGLALGVRHAGVSFEGNSFYNSLGTSSSNGAASGLFVGGRYFFMPNLGAFAELGYDQSYLKVGLSGKF